MISLYIYTLMFGWPTCAVWRHVHGDIQTFLDSEYCQLQKQMHEMFYITVQILSSGLKWLCKASVVVYSMYVVIQWPNLAGYIGNTSRSLDFAVGIKIFWMSSGESHAMPLGEGNSQTLIC